MAQRDTNPDHEHLLAARPAQAMLADRRPALKRQT